MQGDGSTCARDIQELDVHPSIDADGTISLTALATLVGDLETNLRSDGAAVYVHAGSPDSESQAAIVCACVLAKLYELSAEEAFARVRGYCEVRGDGPDRIFDKGTDAPLETVCRYIRKARASDCAED